MDSYTKEYLYRGIGVLTDAGRQFILDKLNRLAEVQNELRWEWSREKSDEKHQLYSKLGIESITDQWHVPGDWGPTGDWDECVHTDFFVSPRFLAFLVSLVFLSDKREMREWDENCYDLTFFCGDYKLPGGRILKVGWKFDLEVI